MRKLISQCAEAQRHYEYDTRSQVAKARKRCAAGSDSEILAGTQGEYAYDLIGNRTSWKWGGDTEYGSALRTTSYTINALNQYTQLANPQSYDVTGRRTGTNSVSILVNGASQTPNFQSGASGPHFWAQPTHDSAKGLYDSVTVTTAGIPADVGTQYIPAPTTSPEYDWDGNLTSDGRWAYTWDCENRLVSMECAPQLANTPTGAIAVPGYRLTFTYDGLSRRIAKKTEYRNISTAAWSTLDHLGFAYDGWNMVMSCRMGGYGGRVASYVWGPDIGSSGYANADWQKAGGVGGLLMVLDGVSTPTYGNTSGDPTDDDYFPLFDRLGNIIGYRKAAVSTTSVDYNNLGATGALYDYDAFGRELRSSGPAADLVPFHFSTKFTDQETGLNYYGYRYYDPQNGRWLNRDPIGERGGVNLQYFLENNGVNGVDVLGLFNEGNPYAGPGAPAPPPPSPPSPPSPPPPPPPSKPFPVEIPWISNLNCGCNTIRLDYGEAKLRWIAKVVKEDILTWHYYTGNGWTGYAQSCKINHSILLDEIQKRIPECWQCRRLTGAQNPKKYFSFWLDHSVVLCTAFGADRKTIAREIILDITGGFESPDDWRAYYPDYKEEFSTIPTIPPDRGRGGIWPK